MLFEASAPGSLMLLGEYAVLHGEPALVVAVDKRLSVRLIPRSDNQINIKSNLGQMTIDRLSIPIVAPFTFILAVLKKFQKKLPSGCDIEVMSDFSAQIGFASSAAVTAASLAIMDKWLNLHYSLLELARLGRTIIRQVQGQGSGADIAACIFGGIVYYRAQPFSIEKLSGLYPITVIYSGMKTPTSIAISNVNQAFLKRHELFQALCRAIGHCVEEGRAAIQKNEWIELGKVMNIQQGLMEALGVNTTNLQDIVYTLRNQDTILGAKISGSGFGDSAIGLGLIPKEVSLTNYTEQRIQVSMTDVGVVCEKK